MTASDQRDYPALLRSFDTFEPSHEEFKYDAFSYARQKCPVTWTESGTGFWLLTRYQDVRRVLEDPQTFSSVEGSPQPTPITLGPLTADPPQHSGLRKILNPYFSRTFSLRYEDDIRAYAADLIEQWVDNGRVELLSEFTGPLVSKVLARMVFDEDDEEKMARAKDIVMRVTEESSEESFFELATLSAEYLADAVDNPPERDGVLKALVTSTIDGRPLTEDEQLGTIAVLFLGGLDTTRSAIGTIAMHIAMRPELEERVRDPRWVRQDMDEFLRLVSPVATFARKAMKDVEVGGVHIKEGERVLVRFDSANRDEEKFPEAESLQFDPPRGGNAAFGLGVHRCLGMHLARVQIAIAFEELFKRITNLRLEVDPSELEWAPGIANTPNIVPLTFDKVDA
jgi:cytochrome P450